MRGRMILPRKRLTAMTAVHALWRLSRARVRETTCGRGCWAGTTLGGAVSSSQDQQRTRCTPKSPISRGKEH